MKKRVHIIHHTHWDMEWYFTTHDASALLNYSLKHLINELEKNKKETFYFDGQISPFEDISKHPKLFKRFKNLVSSNRLKIGPWYSQPDLRLTSDEGIFRNHHYGQNIVDLKSNKYNYIYTPDSFGFGENIPSIYSELKAKYAILWRGVNRKALKDSVVFNWKVSNGQKIIVYNMASGYFVGRYLYDDETLDLMYKNNILPSIKRQTEGGKYTVAVIPSGGDQQPYNSNIKKAIAKLNDKKDGYEYLLSTWEDFFQELEPQIKNIPTYEGSHIHAYGGRLHKLVGAHRADIKKLIYRTEMVASRALEPLLLMSSISLKMYPEIEMDKMWKKILLSQAHDAYASCNSDLVNKEIKGRLKQAQNILEANKDMIIRLIAKNYEEGDFLIINPTQYQGKNVFCGEIATKSKDFFITNLKNKQINFIIERTTKNNGGVKVTYTANGEIEKKSDDFYVHKIKLFCNTQKTSIQILKIHEALTKKVSISSTNITVNFKNKVFQIEKNNQISCMDINFLLDAGDGYDLDLYDEIQPLNLSSATVKLISEFHNGDLQEKRFAIEIKIPSSLEKWLQNEKDEILKGVLVFTCSNIITINLSFFNLQKNLLVQPNFSQKHSLNNHLVLTQNGYVQRENQMYVSEQEISKLREKPSDYDFMHGAVLVGDSVPLLFSSLDVREYKITRNKIYFNLLRTPDVLGRSNLRIRPGRASGLSNKVVYTPDSTSELNGEKFKINIHFNPTNFDKSHVIDKMVLEKFTIHKQDLYEHNSKVNSWTLPNIDTSKKLLPNIYISNENFTLISFFKSKSQIIARINNPLSADSKTDIIIMEKKYKNILIRKNETKTIKFKQ